MAISKPYDNGSRRLLTVSAQDLLDWLAPGACFTGQFSEQFQSAELDADSMIETIRNGEREFVQIEFQSVPDPDMAQRLLEYSILAYRRYQCPVRSYVLYLRKGGEPPKPPLIRKYTDGEKFLWFRYKPIQIWNMPHREWLDQDCKGLFPLVPLMRGGARCEVVEEVIDRLQPANDTISKERLALTGLFADLAFSKPEDKLWSKRRFAMLDDIFKETLLYQHIRSGGLDEGRETERERELRSLQQKLLDIFQKRYPKLNQLAQKKLTRVNDPEVLEQLFANMLLASNESDVKQYLSMIKTRRGK